MDGDQVGLGGGGWSEAVEDLVDCGDVEGAISVLESVVADLQAVDRCPRPPSDDLSLASALSDLADINDSRGFSLKADELRSRALALRSRSAASAAAAIPAPVLPSLETEKEEVERREEESASRVSSTSKDAEEDQDNWEAIADRGLHDTALLSSQSEAGVSSEASVEEVSPKRRGRGSFLYKNPNSFYSEQLDATATVVDDKYGAEEDSPVDLGHLGRSEATGVRAFRHGTNHVLVLHDFPPTTRTIDLERLFEKYKDGGAVIRWVNDIIALAVFRTPALAQEAYNNINCSLKVRLLEENDSLLAQITSKDLEPPYARPKTCARTAQRMISQVMGIKPSTEFGSAELRKQEEERKKRILARQALRDDAWGSDEEEQ